MQSLKELFRIGPGPSSSHTIAPKRAAELFKHKYPEVNYVEVELYGSLSLTGKGHGTDEIIIKTFEPIKVNISFKLNWKYPFPNGLIIHGYKDNLKLAEWVVYSVGGGSIEILGQLNNYNQEIYPEKNFKEVLSFIHDNNYDLFDYVSHYEADILVWLNKCVSKMIDSVERGLDAEGLIKGKLKISKSAKQLYNKANELSDEYQAVKLRIMSYAYAANEENASGNEVVTAPTLGSCGVVSAISYYLIKDLKYPLEDVSKALAVGGVFGNIIKQNATISGAVGGCQAEIGVACSMAGAMLAYLNKLSTKEIEYAAEIGVEHHLGLTCDPVGGYVIIPCIERNALAALRSIDNYELAKYMYPIKNNAISFDMVVNTMNFTGQKIPIELKETSLGGLAKEYEIK